MDSDLTNILKSGDENTKVTRLNRKNTQVE